jgi:hypothetical protein
LGGLGNVALYNRVHVGTKKLIENYIATVVEGLNQVLNYEEMNVKV